MPKSDPPFKMIFKSDELQRIESVEPTEDAIDTVRRICANNASDAAELAMFLDMLGIAP